MILHKIDPLFKCRQLNHLSQQTKTIVAKQNIDVDNTGSISEPVPGGMG